MSDAITLKISFAAACMQRMNRSKNEAFATTVTTNRSGK
jgi:hypothetical protein